MQGEKTFALDPQVTQKDACAPRILGIDTLDDFEALDRPEGDVP
jgi:hypothetical protein